MNTEEEFTIYSAEQKLRNTVRFYAFLTVTFLVKTFSIYFNFAWLDNFLLEISRC